MREGKSERGEGRRERERALPEASAPLLSSVEAGGEGGKERERERLPEG